MTALPIVDDSPSYDPTDAVAVARYGLAGARHFLEWVLQSVTDAEAAIEDNPAKAIIEMFDVVSHIDHERSGHHPDDIVQHFVHLARGLGSGRPERRCCSLGISQQDEMAVSRGASRNRGAVVTDVETIAGVIRLLRLAGAR